MRSTLTVFVAAALAASGYSQAKVGSFDLIQRGDLRAHLEFIAHDLLEGRDTPSRGLDLATLYVKSQLKLWGLTPAGDKDSFYQSVPLVSRQVDTKASSISFGGETFAYGDFTATASALEWSGPVIYVGHGVQAPAMGVDPYGDMDLKGKILLIRGSAPAEIARSEGAKSAESIANEKGALGVVYVSNQTGSAWEDTVSASLFPGRARPAWSGGESRRGRTMVTIGSELASKMLAGVSDTDPMKPVGRLLTQPFSVKVTAGDMPVATQNVVAIVPGTDPVLSKEYVAVSAHIDHVGMRETPPGVDGIYNGADDDGSGVVAVLELAHAFATGKRPKRSILFIWHTGEEKGLWGSEYYANNPTVPLNALTALINIDMIGRSRPMGDTNPRNNVRTPPNAIYVVGSKRISTELGEILQDINRKTYNLTYDYKYDDPNDRENIYGRSDHYNYALKGVPIAFYFDGVHQDYHQPGDEIDKIDFDKMEKVTRTIYSSLWELANRKARVNVDAPK